MIFWSRELLADSPANVHTEQDSGGGQLPMVERRIELDRRYRRKKKMKKLKAKLQTATGAEREKILYKIRRLSPFWKEPPAQG
jgi:hypothetical protein